MIKALLFSLMFSVVAVAAPADRVDITHTEESVDGTTGLHLAANPTRNYLLLQNKGSASVYVKFGSAHSGTEGIELAAGQSYEPIKAPADAIYMKSASGTQTVLTAEGN